MSNTQRHILLVEDNDDHAMLITRMLKKVQDQVSVARASTIMEAKDYLRQHNVDAVLLDLYLPDSNGLETVKKLLGNLAAIPVIVLTSLNDEKIALETLQHGAQEYLCKDNLDPSTLSRSIRYSIERKRLEKIKDEFLSVVSHELRTPLTSIRGSLGVILAGTDEGIADVSLKMLTIAQRNCERLIRLVNDLLEIKKMESGEFDLSTKPVDLIALIKQSIKANFGYAQEHDISFELASPLKALLVEGDVDRLMQVLANLLSNAAKFSPAQSTVIVKAEVLDKMARISVTDQGEGIPEDQRGKIFQKFTQVDSSIKRAKGGTGLGLSISKQIIELHEGSIGFESEVGIGTTFYFELPIHEPVGVAT